MSANAKRLQEAADLLELAEAGLKQVTGDNDARRIPGVRNVFVFGRAFLDTMEKLAARDPLFASWFDRQQLPDGVDKLARLVLREKKARLGYTKVELASAGKEFGPRPVNARAFFSGDRLGGTGWDIELPGGQLAKYYVSLPDELPVGYSFDGASLNAANLLRSYVKHLREVMRHAKITAG